MKSTVKVDAWNNCIARYGASFFKGEGWADSFEIPWQAKKKKINNDQIRENPNPGVGEGVLSLW